MMRHENKKPSGITSRRLLPVAKPLGGENLGFAIPASRFGGKKAPPRLFRGYAQSGLPIL
jgi:hypothetical protein